jgi:hypothetical protein
LKELNNKAKTAYKTINPTEKKQAEVFQFYADYLR